MHIALVHNEHAGDRTYAAADLVRMLQDLGHSTVLHARNSEGLLGALNSHADVMIVSGGDGTVARVAVALCGSETPLLILPTGTSNNIAFGVGVGHRSVPSLVQNIANARVTRLDVWRMGCAGDEVFFVESAGIGVIGEMLTRERKILDETWRRLRGRLTRGGDHWERTARYVGRLLRRQPACWIDIIADGRDFSGEYVTIEMMNIRAVGPRIALAPHADPGDGWLDLLLVTRDEQEMLADAIEARRVETLGHLLPARRVRGVELEWPMTRTHIDDEGSFTAKTCHGRRAAVTLRGAVRLLIPD